MLKTAGFGSLVSFVGLLFSCSMAELEAAREATPTAAVALPEATAALTTAPTSAPMPPSTTTTTSVLQIRRPWRSEIYTIGTVDTTLPPEEAAIVDAYLAFREAFLEAEMGPDVNPDHPGLAAYAVEPALAVVQDILRGYVADGTAARLPENTVHALAVWVDHWVDQFTSVLGVCSVNDVVLYAVSSGASIDDHVSTRGIRVEMVMSDGLWMVSRQDVLSKEPEVVGCALLHGLG